MGCRLPRSVSVPRWLHEYCDGADGGVREWATEGQIWRCIYTRKQCTLHQHAETKRDVELRAVCALPSPTCASNYYRSGMPVPWQFPASNSFVESEYSFIDSAAPSSPSICSTLAFRIKFAATAADDDA